MINVLGDELADYNPATSHLHACRKEWSSNYDCSRNCMHRLYDLCVRTEALLNPKSTAPECVHHMQRQHRDGLPPWCDDCGWNHGTTGTPAAKYGPRSADWRVGKPPEMPPGDDPRGGDPL